MIDWKEIKDKYHERECRNSVDNHWNTRNRLKDISCTKSGNIKGLKNYWDYENVQVSDDSMINFEESLSFDFQWHPSYICDVKISV